MGLPIEKLIVATNQNDILHRALSSGDYVPDGVTPSISPSMDIQVSSNFERALFDAYGRDGGAVAQLMEELKAGGFHISQGALEALRAEFASGRASEAETSAMIARARAGWASFCARIPPSACMWRRASPGRRRWSRWPPRIPRNSPTRSRPQPASARPCRRAWPTCWTGPNGCARRERSRRHRGADRGGRLRVTVELHTLKNGLRIVVEPMPGLQSASVGLWVSAGGRHERAEQNGIAHFLEHMAFKGTARRSALQIAEEIEDVGGYINAYTSREVTAYYARVLKEDVPLAVDLIADIVLNPAFDPTEIEIERGVILQEIGQAADTPDDIIFDWLQEEAFPGQPLGRTILGPASACAASPAAISTGSWPSITGRAS
jgi:hypothetical protein